MSEGMQETLNSSRPEMTDGATNAARTLGTISVVLGALSAGIMFVGGCDCGWIAWPLVIVALITGLLAVGSKDKTAETLGKWGMALAVAVPVIRFVLWLVIANLLHFSLG
jgi:hypothetical protein